MMDVRFVEPDFSLPLLEGKTAELRAEAEFRKGLWRQIKNLAQQQGRSLFVAAEEGHVVAVGLSKVARVLKVEGEEVLISDSHARHRLDQGVVLSAGGWYRFAIDPASNRILKADEHEPILKAYEREPRLLDLEPSKSKFPINLSDLPSVKPAVAQAFFSRLRRQPHIPFQYPSNGCWVRAHEMARLIERYFDPNPKDVVAKIWNFGKLVVDTDNNPYCSVSWEYHVAPVIRAGKKLLVIDPALFEKPVSIGTWKKRQSDPSAKSKFTSRHVYKFEEGELLGEIPGETQQELEEHWGYLLSLILDNGPLPYRCESLA